MSGRRFVRVAGQNWCGAGNGACVRDKLSSCCTRCASCSGCSSSCHWCHWRPLTRSSWWLESSQGSGCNNTTTRRRRRRVSTRVGRGRGGNPGEVQQESLLVMRRPWGRGADQGFGGATSSWDGAAGVMGFWDATRGRFGVWPAAGYARIVPKFHGTPAFPSLPTAQSHQARARVHDTVLTLSKLAPHVACTVSRQMHYFPQLAWPCAALSSQICQLRLSSPKPPRNCCVASCTPPSILWS